MKKRQMAEHQRGALVISSVPSFASVGGMGGTDWLGGTVGSGRISSLEAVVECLERHLDAVIGNF